MSGATRHSWSIAAREAQTNRHGGKSWSGAASSSAPSVGLSMADQATGRAEARPCTAGRGWGSGRWSSLKRSRRDGNARETRCDENSANVCMVRPMDRRLLGRQEAPSIPIPCSLSRCRCAVPIGRWRLMDIRIQDCMTALADFPDESVDCILTDPPYGETSLPWDKWPEGWPTAVRRVLKRTGSMWCFGSQRMFLERISEFSGWKMSHDIVWEKHNGTGLFNDRFRRVHELALHFYRDDARWADVYKCPQYTNDARARTVRKKGRPAQWIGATGETIYRSEDGGPRLMRSVMFHRSEHGKAAHPTQKPIAIVEPLLLYACPPGGTVLDVFAGSGTVGLCAARHGMKAILIEADRTFEDVIRKRIEGDAPLLKIGA